MQKFLGHSDVSTTMNVYNEIAHVTREAKKESAKLLDKVVGMNESRIRKTFPCNLPIRAKTREKYTYFKVGITHSHEIEEISGKSF